MEALVGPVVVRDPGRGDVDARFVVLGVGDGRHVRAMWREVEEPDYQVQGDPSGFSLGFVDMKTKVAFQYMLLIQGDPSCLGLGLGLLRFWLFHDLPDSALVDER